jgi:predicted permease
MVPMAASLRRDGPRQGRTLRRSITSGGVLEDLLLDLRFAIRGLRRNPTFALVAVATVAIGMGATTAMLSIANALFRPPRVAESDRLVSVWEDRTASAYNSFLGRHLPYPRYEAYRSATSDVFAGLAGHSYRSFAVVADDGAVSINGFLTSGNYFEVLGIAPALGRLYDSDDEESVVLSERLWRSRFGADRGVIGRTIPIGSRTFTITGVAAPGFTGTTTTFTGDLWVSVRAYARVFEIEEEELYVVPIGRLLPGVDPSLGRERVFAAAQSIPPEASNIEVRGVRFDSLVWPAAVVDVLRLALGILLLAAVLVLLIACANIAAMTVARADDRRREIAVRLAIGAGRGRLVCQMVAESVLLALIGGLGGVVLAHLGMAALSSLQIPANVTVTLDATPDVRVLTVSFLIAAATGVLFGLQPALRSASADLTTSLKDGSQGPRMSLRRNTFVAAQLALATVLLITAGLFVRSFEAIGAAPLGFDPEGVTVATLAVSTDYDRDEARIFYDRVLERVRALPSVEAAGIGTFVLLGGSNAGRTAIAGGGGDDARRTYAEFNIVDPGFFDAMGIELLQGRFLTDADTEHAPSVAVVNEILAERLWPGQAAVGRRFRSGGDEREVVGVARNGLYVTAAEGPTAYVFHPFAQEYSVPMTLHVRSSGALPSVVAEVRGIVRGLDPNLALGEWWAMEDVVSASRLGQRFLAGVSSLFALIGLGLGALGVYGLLAVQVARRKREFGVRMALGARTADVLFLVLGRGARLAALGCLVGVLLAAVVGRRLTSLLYYAVSPFDFLTFVLVPAVLLGAAVLASLIPAHRATRASAAATLREE